jgi:hypothetical protein
MFLIAMIFLLYGIGNGSQESSVTPPIASFSNESARKAASTIQRLYPAMSRAQQTGMVAVPVVETAQQLMGLAPDGRIGPDTRARCADLGYGLPS